MRLGATISAKHHRQRLILNTGLNDEKCWGEIVKLQAEVQELKAWCWKVVMTALTPIMSVFLFLPGWHGSHLTERRQQNQELYTRAAKEVASRDTSVRLSGVKAIDTLY
jgi:hypothetical protein